MMRICIDGEVVEVDRVYDGCYLPMIEEGRRDWYVAKSHDEAGQAARQYWQELAESDPKEFACIVGEETLIAWALHQSAGPGSTQVRSLEEWLDLWLDTPEEEFAGYDGEERTIESMTVDLAEDLGWHSPSDDDPEEWRVEDEETGDLPLIPLADFYSDFTNAVAYRHN